MKFVRGQELCVAWELVKSLLTKNFKHKMCM
jgi:hypothetical protein